MVIIAEENGLSDKQHGLRKNRICTDAANIKLLVFECTGVNKSIIWEGSYNCKACFDRAERSQSDILVQKESIVANLLLARDLCVEKVQRHVET